MVQKNCQAHPDEKGIETDQAGYFDLPRDHDYCKAHPDEKRIETLWGRKAGLALAAIARPIPTKRELKHIKRPRPGSPNGLIARPIPTKRELKREIAVEAGRQIEILQGPSRRKGN